MVITYYGVSCFKAQSGDFVVAFDPPSKQSGVKTPRFQTDVVCISHDHALHNGKDELAGKEKSRSLVVVAVPGEYEIREVVINGISSFHDAEGGRTEGPNTIYVAVLEGMRICHLGDFGEAVMRPETKEAIGHVDVLFVPVGGNTVMGPEKAGRVVSAISPRVVIPMHYDIKGHRAATGDGALESFLEELGNKQVKTVDRFSVKKKEIEEMSGAVVVLEPMLS